MERHTHIRRRSRRKPNPSIDLRLQLPRCPAAQVQEKSEVVGLRFAGSHHTVRFIHGPSDIDLLTFQASGGSGQGIIKRIDRPVNPLAERKNLVNESYRNFNGLY